MNLPPCIGYRKIISSRPLRPAYAERRDESWLTVPAVPPYLTGSRNPPARFSINVMLRSALRRPADAGLPRSPVRCYPSMAGYSLHLCIGLNPVLPQDSNKFLPSCQTPAARPDWGLGGPYSPMPYFSIWSRKLRDFHLASRCWSTSPRMICFNCSPVTGFTST